MKSFILSRNALVLSFVGFFVEVALETLYPIMPMYLASIGFLVLLIGILEGFVEAKAEWSKQYFSKLIDNHD